jgi:hypothetical protein
MELIVAPSTLPLTKIDEKIIKDAKGILREESQVIVHCIYNALEAGDRIRIWKTTFLLDKYSSHRSKLIHVEKISLYPRWTFVNFGKSFCFTLIFSALPRSCTSFDLIEEIPEPGGFSIQNMKRNKLDVYEVSV